MRKHTDQVLGACRERIAVGQVGEEILDIRVEGGDRARSDEAIHVHVAVHAIPDLPGRAAHISSAHLGSDWCDISIPTKPTNESTVSKTSQSQRYPTRHDDAPDHELIVAAVGDMVDIGGGEQIIRNICPNIGVVVAPFGGGGNTRDVADELLLQLHARVRVALHRVLAPRPIPGGVPRNTITRDAVEIGTLGSRSRVLPPHVVVDGVLATGVGAILLAELLGSNSCGQREDRNGLHAC